MPTLAFKQQVTDTSKFEKLVDDKIFGFCYEEGFTCINVCDGKIFMNDRPLNLKEHTYGTIMPKISSEQIEAVQHIANLIKHNVRLSSKKIFLLCSNDDSRWLSSGNETISILGYYNENNNFVFAINDFELSQFNGVKQAGLAREIFSRDGIVVIPSPDNTQPITVVNENSNYYKITQLFYHAKKMISEFLPKAPFISDDQAFFYILLNFGSEKTEDILSIIGNEKKRQKFQLIKENCYYFYTLFDSEVFNGKKKIFLRYRSNLENKEKTYLMERERLHELWKTVYGAVMKDFQQSQDIDTFKKLAAKALFVKCCRLCCRFNGSKHFIKQI